MERLTERHENGSAMIKGCGANCKYGFAHCRKEDWENYKTIDDMIGKLADYEDAEEQGLLVKVVHGEWIFKNDGAYGKLRTYCSACGKRSGIGGIVSNQLKPYCPNCGAKMREEAEKALADMGV